MSLYLYVPSPYMSPDIPVLICPRPYMSQSLNVPVPICPQPYMSPSLCVPSPYIMSPSLHVLGPYLSPVRACLYVSPGVFSICPLLHVSLILTLTLTFFVFYNCVLILTNPDLNLLTLT